MLTRFLLLFIALGCGVDRSPVFATTAGASGGTSGLGGGGTGGIAGVGGISGMGGIAGVGGISGMGGTGSVCPTSCDDGVFCNGVETCGPSGCVAGTAPCTTACDETTRTCNAPCIGGFESCNGIDDDCNGMIDDGFGSICLLPNVNFALCSAATCVVASCSAGFLNCDGNASNGCETFSDPTPNDCKAIVCGGGVTAQPNDTPIDDGNDCTIERCNGSTPEVVNVDDGESCTNGNGMCVGGSCVY